MLKVLHGTPDSIKNLHFSSLKSLPFFCSSFSNVEVREYSKLRISMEAVCHLDIVGVN